MAKPKTERALRAAGDAPCPEAVAPATHGRDAHGRFLSRDVRVETGVDAVPARRPPKPRRTPGRKARKPVRWSARRQDLFLATLAETANVARSVRASGLSETTVYRKRRASEAFRTLWMAALREGVVKLETQLLDRALNGVEKPVWHGGRQVGTVTEFNDRIALALIAAHRATVHGVAAAPPQTLAEMRKALEGELAQMNCRMGGAG